MTEPELRHLLLIGAHRDNEVNSDHPLIRKLEAIRSAGATVHEIVLAPLSRQDLEQLIGDALHCKAERVTALAEVIHEKTAGNPFFANQLISVLVEEGLLTFDYGEGRWSWDLNSIHAKGYTDNVADLVVGKLVRLPVKTQQALQLLACMGNNAECVLLEMLSQQSSEQMHGQLLEAIFAELIFFTEQSYTFFHDRVQRSSVLLSPRKRTRRDPSPNRESTRRAHYSRAAGRERIFDIVNQLNRGSHLISSAREGKRLAELNLIAGRRAKGSTAYTSALSYLRTARAALTEKDWDHEYGLIFSIEYDTAECELLTADMVAAENWLSMLAQRAKPAHDIARVTSLRVMLYKILGQSDRGIEVALEYLRDGGIDWSMHPTREEVVSEYDRVWSQLGSRKVDELLDLPLQTNPDVLHIMDILNEMIVPAHDCDHNLPPLIICRMVNLSFERGNSDGSCVAYLGLAMIAGPFFGNYSSTATRFGQLGYNLVEQLGLKRFRARVYAVFGNVILPWTRHVREGRDLIRRAFDAANEMGDLAWAAHSRNYLVGNLLASGERLAEVQHEAEESLAFLRKVRFGIVVDIVTTQLALIRTLRGLTPKFGCFDDGDMNERRMEDHLSGKPVLAIAGVLVLDPEIAGALFCGRLYRGLGCYIEGATVAPDVIVTSRNRGVLLLRCTFPRGDPGISRLPIKTAAFRCIKSPQRPAPHLGAELSREFRKPRGTCSAPRSPRSKAASSMLRASTSRRPARPAQMALSTMRRSPTNSPHAFTRRVDSSSSRTSICATPATAISGGEP